MQKNILIFKKQPQKETKNPAKYYNSIINLKFQHKPKSFKNPHIKNRPIAKIP